MTLIPFVRKSLHFFQLGPSFSRTHGYIHESAIIGLPPQMRDYKWGTRHFGVDIDKTARIGALCTIDGGYEAPTIIGKDVFLMKSCHVGHDVVISQGCEIAPLCSIGGYVILCENVKVGQGVTFKPKVKVGIGAVIGAGAVVTKDVPAGEVWAGVPAKRLEPYFKRRGGRDVTLSDETRRNWEQFQSDREMWLELYGRSRYNRV